MILAQQARQSKEKQIMESPKIRETITIRKFIEHDPKKQRKMEKMLRQSKLEEITSPIYCLFHINAMIIGW